MRIEYAGSVHDEAEIEAVLSVLRGGPTALRIGKHVREMEQRVAALFGKRRGVMCNSGSPYFTKINSTSAKPKSNLLLFRAKWTDAGRSQEDEIDARLCLGCPDQKGEKAQRGNRCRD